MSTIYSHSRSNPNRAIDMDNNDRLCWSVHSFLSPNDPFEEIKPDVKKARKLNTPEIRSKDQVQKYFSFNRSLFRTSADHGYIDPAACFLDVGSSSLGVAQGS